MSFVIAAAVVVGGAAAYSAYGQYKAGQAASDAATTNAHIAEQNAQIALDQGDAAAEAQHRTAERKLGAEVAAYGASGVQGSSGSPMDVLADSVREATLDNLNIKYNAKMRAQGYKTNSNLDYANASYSRTAGEIGATGSLLKGLGSIIPMFGGPGTTAAPAAPFESPTMSA